jgi:hypothetical protein
MGVVANHFYYANGKEIKIIEIPNRPQSKEDTVEYKPETSQYITYEIKGTCRLLSIFENSFSKDGEYLMCAIETDDFQIDSTRLYFWSKDIKEADLVFYQYREVVHRDDVFNDPIVKFKQTIKED